MPDPTFQWTAGLELIAQPIIIPSLTESPLDYSLLTFCSSCVSHAAVCFKFLIISTSSQVSAAFSPNLTDSSIWIQGSSCNHPCFRGPGSLEFLLFSKGRTFVHMAGVICLPAIWKITTLSRSHQ